MQAIIDFIMKIISSFSKSKNIECPVNNGYSEPSQPPKDITPYLTSKSYQRSLQKLGGIKPELQTLARKLLEECAKQGIWVLIYYGFRTRAEQEALYAQGRTKPGKIVTNAKPGTSKHEIGEAIDCAPVKDGKIDWNSPDFDKIGAIGKSMGLVWGGDFTKIKDKPHFQLPTA